MKKNDNILFPAFVQRTAYHIQVFALSKWLAVDLPIEYYEFARGIQWIIPHIKLPWETVGDDAFIENHGFYVGTDSDIFDRHQFITEQLLGGLNNTVQTKMSITGTPLTPMEYRSFIEVWSSTHYFYTLVENVKKKNFLIDVLCFTCRMEI